MKTVTPIRKLTLTAVCVALCCVFPQVLPQPINRFLSPIHIPVLLCGLICGGGWGALCGGAGILLAALFGKPPISQIPTMLPELVAYGLACGLGMRFIRTGKAPADVYISLVLSMAAGRIVGGIANAIVGALTTGGYSIALWLTNYFVNAIPGIVAHLILVPLLVFTLTKARVIPGRYPK